MPLKRNETSGRTVGTQVVFRFGKSSEVRYVETLPERGERVMHGGALWEVVVTGTSGGHKATCVLEPVSERRSGPDEPGSHPHVQATSFAVGLEALRG